MARTEPVPNFLIRWTIQALLAAVLSVVLVEAAVQIMAAIGRLTTSTASQPGFQLAAPLVVAIVAALITGGLLYRWQPDAAGEGIPAYLQAVESDARLLPLGATLIKYPAAILTLAAYGSGGLVGPLGRVSAGISQWVSTLLQRSLPRLFADRDVHHQHYHAPTTAAVSGMAAAVTAIFSAPIAAAVFAVEVVQKDQLRYHQLVPAALASSATLLLQRSLGWAAPGRMEIPVTDAATIVILPVVGLALVAGLIGLLYTGLYRRLAGRLRRNRRRISTRNLVIGMLGSACIGLALHPGLSGTSRDLLQKVLSGEISGAGLLILPRVSRPELILLALGAGKLLGNCITTGSGMSAGFTAPALFVGASLGAAVALISGFDAGSPGYLVLASSGMAAMLASVINTPLAAAVLVAELFGIAYAPAATVASMLAFQVARSRTIYEVALDERSD